MAMTLKVYEVNQEGRARVLVPQAEVLPVEAVEASQQFPACRCPQCAEV